MLRAAAYGNAYAVSLLLEHGANINELNKVRLHNGRVFMTHGSQAGESALLRASRWGHADVVFVLLSAGADTSTTDDVSTLACFIIQICLENMSVLWVCLMPVRLLPCRAPIAPISLTMIVIIVVACFVQ